MDCRASPRADDRQTLVIFFLHFFPPNHSFDQPCLDLTSPVWIFFKLGAKMVERLVQAHTNLVLREALDLAMECLLPWDIELVIEEPEQESD